jgi:hypothetical protein
VVWFVRLDFRFYEGLKALNYLLGTFYFGPFNLASWQTLQPIENRPSNLQWLRCKVDCSELGIWGPLNWLAWLMVAYDNNVQIVK